MQQRHGNGVARREKREILNADKVMHVMGYAPCREKWCIDACCGSGDAGVRNDVGVDF